MMGDSKSLQHGYASLSGITSATAADTGNC